MKRHIPNTLTSANLVCGMIGIILAFQGNLSTAVSLIWLAGIFDFLDGFAARMLKVSSSIGKELDSLADMVTFGVLPSLVMFLLIKEYSNIDYLPYTGLFIGVFSALRLAKFNVDEKQAMGFIGLPTPATALFVSSLPYILSYDWANGLDNQIVVIALIAISVVLSLLMVAELPLLALKFKNFSLKDNKLRFVLIISSVILIAAVQVLAIPLVILLYVILSLFEKDNAN